MKPTKSPAEGAQKVSPLEPLLKIEDVIAYLGIGKSAIYENIKAGRFPGPIRITPNAVRWRRGDIDRWLSQKAGGE